jgi:hypothetical protein
MTGSYTRRRTWGVMFGVALVMLAFSGVATNDHELTTEDLRELYQKIEKNRAGTTVEAEVDATGEVIMERILRGKRGGGKGIGKRDKGKRGIGRGDRGKGGNKSSMSSKTNKSSKGSKVIMERILRGKKGRGRGRGKGGKRGRGKGKGDKGKGGNKSSKSFKSSKSNKSSKSSQTKKSSKSSQTKKSFKGSKNSSKKSKKGEDEDEDEDDAPSSANPSNAPSTNPSNAPSVMTNAPSEPSDAPTQSPTKEAILLYSNDFESPNRNITRTKCVNLDGTPININYGGPQGDFSQRLTVETVIIKSDWNAQIPYEDPLGIGGNYAIGMLSTIGDDILALGFSTGRKNFINVAMDISSIDTNGGCGGPFGIAPPLFRVSLIDDPTGTVPVLGTVLDSALMAGEVGPNSWTFLWTRNAVSLDATRVTNDTVSIVFDLLQSGYGVLDNLQIEASIFAQSLT